MLVRVPFGSPTFWFVPDIERAIESFARAPNCGLVFPTSGQYSRIATSSLRSQPATACRRSTLAPRAGSPSCRDRRAAELGQCKYQDSVGRPEGGSEYTWATATCRKCRQRTRLRSGLRQHYPTRNRCTCCRQRCLLRKRETAVEPARSSRVKRVNVRERLSLLSFLGRFYWAKTGARISPDNCA
jgi:hypothetical protein